MTNSFMRIFVLFSLVFILTACGFKLRGQAYLPPEIRTIYLQSHAPFGPFTQQLRQTLIDLNIKIVDNAQAAPLTLNILSEGTQRQLTGLSTTSSINTYILIYTVHFQIVDKDGRVLGENRSVSARRNQTVNANEALSTNNEYTLYEQDMRREAIFQIISQLGSQSVRKHLRMDANNGAVPGTQNLKQSP